MEKKERKKNVIFHCIFLSFSLYEQRSIPTSSHFLNDFIRITLPSYPLGCVVLIIVLVPDVSWTCQSLSFAREKHCVPSDAVTGPTWNSIWIQVQGLALLYPWTTLIFSSQHHPGWRVTTSNPPPCAAMVALRNEVGFLFVKQISIHSIEEWIYFQHLRKAKPARMRQKLNFPQSTPSELALKCIIRMSMGILHYLFPYWAYFADQHTQAISLTEMLLAKKLT